MRNLNIGRKLTLSYGVMAGFVLLLVFGTTTVLKTVERDFEHLAGQTFNMVRDIEELRAAGLRILGTSAEFALIHQADQHPGPDKLDISAMAKEELEERDHAVRSYYAAFATYSDQVDRFFPDEVGLRDAIRKSGTALLAGTDRLIALAAKGAPSRKILNSTRILEEIEESYLVAIKAARDHENLEFRERESAIQDDIAHANQFAWLGLALVIAAIALLGGFMTRHITGPLRKLTGAAEKLGEGELQTRVTLDRGDELGVLGTAFNRMAGSLQVSIAEREEAENHLRESHKIQAIGQLTGGMSHDFNNLLAVILGNAELIREKGVRAYGSEIEAIARAANRGAELTQRMLAFGRRQPLKPRAIDLAAVVHGMVSLLQRTLGKTIKVSIVEDADLWLCEADPGQVENALLNLALNARDAMPEGGRLTISFSNARLGQDETGGDPEFKAGEYVALRVADTGSGMSSEVLQRAWEPFFTTKDVGKGSGLGLSMIYGFAKQSGGQVTLQSEEGEGTTVRLYLPRASQEAAAEEERPNTDISAGSGESVLVIEDDEAVLDIVKTLLQDLGYKVHFALTAADARAVLDRENVDLILSDVVLAGGLSGPEFVQRARERDPGLKVVFMSGYPTKSGMGTGLEDADDVLLGKPFSIQKLASAIRDTLD